MSNEQIQIIPGGIATDHRGQIRFVNGFDMTDVKRFYILKNSDINLVRGWRGHRIEKRWFYVLSGAFCIDIVKIDDWERASPGLSIESFLLNDTEQNVLYVPEGHATAIKSLHKDSEMLIYADHGIEEAKNDDHTWSLDYFVKLERSN